MSSLPSFPMPRTCPFSAPEEYARLRTEAPAAQVTLPTGKSAWILTRYADVRAVLADPHVSADIRRPNFPAMGIGEQEAGAKSRPFIRTDPPEHTRNRRLLIPELTVKRVRMMRPAVQAITDAALDAMLAAGTSADIVADYANVVSTSTMCELIGLPKDDLEFFHDITRVSGGRGSTADEVSAALGAMFKLFAELIALREREPGDDLLSKLVVDHLRTGTVTHQELLSLIGITVIAGRETTTNMIALSTLLLLREPRLLAELRAEPELLPAAVDEMLRVLSVADSIPLRVATRSIDIAGTVIPADDGVIALLAGADHDPDAFPDPSRVDFRRENRQQHLAFGHGIHQCVGQHLARLELEVALGTLITRIPTLRLAVPFEDLVYRQEAATFGVEKLPVAW